MTDEEVVKVLYNFSGLAILFTMGIKLVEFERAKHIYRNDALVELIRDAVRFFNGTPVQPLPPSNRFSGTGIYALYYLGGDPLYERLGELNRLSYAQPIYVGKAVPKGWRQSRSSQETTTESSELFGRLSEHARNIERTQTLSVNDFATRFVIFEDNGSDMIGTIEAALIKLNRPLWNSTVDGFGNHDPGSGRYGQAKSDWDVIHPGRSWAEKCLGNANKRSTILARIKTHLDIKVGGK